MSNIDGKKIGLLSGIIALTFAIAFVAG